MEWWQYLLFSLISVLFGTILGYILSRRGASEERKLRERDQLRSAVRSLLAEVDANLNIARLPFQGRLVPFLTNMWDVHRGQILTLPKNLQAALHEVYVDIQKANAMVSLDLHRGVNLGEPYNEICGKIVERTQKTRALLAEWLKQESVEVE